MNNDFFSNLINEMLEKEAVHLEQDEATWAAKAALVTLQQLVGMGLNPVMGAMAINLFMTNLLKPSSLERYRAGIDAIKPGQDGSVPPQEATKEETPTEAPVPTDGKMFDEIRKLLGDTPSLGE